MCVDRVKISLGPKLRGRFCSFFLRGRNHNFLKLRGLKQLLSQKYITINSSQQVNQIIPTEKSQLNYIK